MLSSWKNSQIIGGVTTTTTTTSNATAPLVDAFNSLRVTDSNSGDDVHKSSANMDTFTGDINDLL